MNQSNNYLGTEKIGKLMLKFSIPCIMSLLVASLYNIVDQIFIGQGVGYLGNGATNVVFPITIIALALALMIGDGCAAFISICQGKKDTASSSESVGNAITLIFVVSIIFAIILAFGRDSILNAFGATENNLIYAEEYYDIIIIGIPFFMLANGLNSVIRADGNPKYAMFSILIGAIINVIVDPIAIFVLHWGMKGAAIATIVGQIVSAVIVVSYMRNPISFKLKKNNFIPDFSIIRKFLPLGVSSFLTQISIVVGIAVMNNMVVIYGAESKYGSDIPLTVVGIVFKVFQIVVSFVVGVAVGVQPIVGYNYGAGNYHRVKEVFKRMIMVETVIGLVSMFLFEVFPLQIISVFGAENDLYNEFAVIAFRIYLCTILLCCIQKAVSIFLQALGKPFMSMGLSLLRDFILVVPLVMVLPMFYGVMGTLFSAPIADIVSMIAVVIMIRVVMKELSSR